MIFLCFGYFLGRSLSFERTCKAFFLVQWFGGSGLAPGNFTGTQVLKFETVLNLEKLLFIATQFFNSTLVVLKMNTWQFIDVCFMSQKLATR